MRDKGVVLLSLISALDGDVSSTPGPARFIPGKETQYPLYRSLGGPQGRSDRVRKISPPSRESIYAILAHLIELIEGKDPRDWDRFPLNTGFHCTQVPFKIGFSVYVF